MEQTLLNPDTITINLIQNGVVIDTVTVSPEDNWTWNFDNLPKYKDGVRPGQITIALLVDGAETGKYLTLTQANNWTGTFTDLDRKQNGQTIVYTVKESPVGNGYSSDVSGNADKGFIITNTRKANPPKVVVVPVFPIENPMKGKPTIDGGSKVEKNVATKAPEVRQTPSPVPLPRTGESNNFTAAALLLAVALSLTMVALRNKKK